MGGLNVAAGALLLLAVWTLLPARWWPVDAVGTVLGLLFLHAGGALLAGTPWARKAAIVAGAAGLAVGVVLVTTLALTASYLSGLYGPVGAGGAVLLAAVAALLLPYLIVFPAAQLFVLAKASRTGDDA